MNRIRRHKPPVPAYLMHASPAPATQASPSNQINLTGNQKLLGRRFKNPNRAPWLEDDLKQLGRKLVKTRTSHHVIRDNVHTGPPVSSRPVPPDEPYHLTSAGDQETAEKQVGIDGMEIEEMKMQEAWAQRQLGMFVRRFCVLGADFKRVKGGYRCTEWEHLVTDELIKQGRGGCYLMVRGSRIEDPVWEGPFYGKEVVEQRPPQRYPGGRVGGRGLRLLGRRY
jgi:hypothetical protein